VQIVDIASAAKLIRSSAPEWTRLLRHIEPEDGHANRAAGQPEQLRATLLSPTSPRMRNSRRWRRSREGRRNLRGAFRWRLATRNVDGSTTAGSIVRYNKAPGQVEPVPQGQGAGQLPAGVTRQVGTSGGKPVYEDAQGNRFVAGWLFLAVKRSTESG